MTHTPKTASVCWMGPGAICQCRDSGTHKWDAAVITGTEVSGMDLLFHVIFLRTGLLFLFLFLFLFFFFFSFSFSFFFFSIFLLLIMLFSFLFFSFLFFSLISFYFILFHFVSFYFILFHFISFYFILFHFISFHFIPFISFHNNNYYHFPFHSYFHNPIIFSFHSSPFSNTTGEKDQVRASDIQPLPGHEDGKSKKKPTSLFSAGSKKEKRDSKRMKGGK